MTKKEIEIVAYLVLIGIVVGALSEYLDTRGFVVPATVVAVGVAVWLLVRHRNERERLRKIEERRGLLLSKYGDENIVEKLLRGTIWVGQSNEQLADALGAPEYVDQTSVETRKKEIWRYYRSGGDRYGLSVTLDDDKVIGWDETL